MADQQVDNGKANASQSDDRRGAGVRFPPPLIFLLCLLAGFGLHSVLPIGAGFSEPVNLLGIVLIVLAFAILLACWLSFRRVNTAIEPWKPTTSMIYNGCYKFSRNPIYLSFCLCLLGIGVFVNSLWLLGSSIVCGYGVFLAAIRKEEAYLEQKFGEDYLAYKRQVRRWL